MADTITATVRLPQEMTAFLKENGSGITAGIVNAVNDLIRLRNISDIELKGIFCPGEWKFFADSLNGTMTLDGFRVSRDALIAHNEDSQTYEDTATRYGIDVFALNQKCGKLTGAQVDALYRRLEKFWDKCAETDLEKWAVY